jgi:release factor glutamine methyltransferase
VPSEPDHVPDLPSLVSALRTAGCVFAENEAGLIGAAASDPAEVAALVERRVAGEPLEHVLGWAEFHGLRLAVTPGVFVPRRRTEFLVDQAAALTRPGAVVLDLCCGSGAVGAALLAVVPGIELHAADLDEAAVRCARRNLPDAQVHQGDLYRPLPPGLRGRIDVLVVIAPYVPTDAIGLMPPEARDHEPPTALDGGPDGLDVLRRILADAPAWLAPDGVLLTELGEDQLATALAEAARCGLAARTVTAPDGSATLVVAGPTLGR